jgi:1-aminocyclopropane-1-carboxylate deaminase
MTMLEKFERYPLTFGPTHIEKLERLSQHLGGQVELYAKREDCNSGLAFGGNKLRKLEYIIPDAIASNADTLVSIGGVQSNHTRMVAAVAAKIGMKCRLVQESWVPHEDAVYDRVGNILLSRIMGADVRLVDEGFDIGIRESWQQAIDACKDALKHRADADASFNPSRSMEFSLDRWQELTAAISPLGAAAVRIGLVADVQRTRRELSSRCGAGGRVIRGRATAP